GFLRRILQLPATTAVLQDQPLGIDRIPKRFAQLIGYWDNLWHRFTPCSFNLLALQGLTGPAMPFLCSSSKLNRGALKIILPRVELVTMAEHEVFDPISLTGSSSAS